MHNPNPDTLQQQMTLSGDTLDSFSHVDYCHAWKPVWTGFMHTNQGLKERLLNNAYPDSLLEPLYVIFLHIDLNLLGKNL